MKGRSSKPYAMVGAGNLTASIWKDFVPDSGWTYRFNVYRLEARHGRVTQRLLPDDISDLVKLARVLAQLISDDGCLPGSLRHELQALAASIDVLSDTQGVTDGTAALQSDDSQSRSFHNGLDE
jgi:hypothetical protein